MNWWILRRQIHTSWLLCFVGAGCLVGVWAAAYVPSGLFGNVIWLVCGIVLIACALYWKYAALLLCCVLGGALVGIWRGSIDLHQLATYDALHGHTVTLRGVIAEDVDVAPGDMSVLRLKQVRYEDEALKGMIWVTIKQSEVQRSDEVEIRGKVSEGFGSFGVAVYRAELVSAKRPVPGDVALAVRDWFADAVRLGIPEPAASLGLGYLLGQRRALPADLMEALQIAGLTHVIVASGYNLTILVRLARRLFARISRYASVLAGGGMVVSFIAVTGMSPSMSRAGLVTGLSLLAWYYGRKFHPLVLLSLAAATTVLINPSYVWGDIGWQLSFAAFAGVMILAPLLQQYFFGDRKPGIIRQILGETLSAQIATLPILIVAFGQFSNIALVANALILPFVPLAMLLTFVAGIGGVLLPFAATIIALPATWMLDVMITVATWLSSVSWAVTEANLSVWFAVGFYVVLIAVCIYLRRATGYSLRNSNIVE